MARPTSVPPGEERDERLARLLADLGEQARQGRAPDVEAVGARHPDLAAELRELWAAAQFADAFARTSVRATPRSPDNGTPPAALPLPRTFGDYELLEEIGRGGMGVVYKAWQKSLRRTVALKMILHGELATAADLARFRAEAQAAAHLEHPHIVSVYDAGEVDGQAYFCMRYVEGQTLAAHMTAGPLRPLDAARILAAVARAVHYAHEKGVLHRDLKPSNILLHNADSQRDGRAGASKVCNSAIPMVTDFGLAKRVPTPGEPIDGRKATVTGAVVGTPAYMAPEQVSGSRGKPSPASDVYSLGVILYEMLTGRPPFQAATPVDTLLLVLDQDPVRPRMLNPTVDPELELVCLKCIQKDPSLRYGSAADLAADLEAIVNGEPPSVRSGSLRELGRFFSRAFRDTPNAAVLENWGVLWMAHSGKVLLQCVLTTWMAWSGVTNPLWYLLLWGGGLVVWGGVFWQMRKRAGPVLFVERQVGHVWAAAVAATIGVFLVEMLLRLPVLTLAPILAVIAGMVFVVKAGMLAGEFYISAAALFLTAVPMALWPDYGPLMFGVAVAVCFFVPGLRYHRQRLRSLRARSDEVGPSK